MQNLFSFSAWEMVDGVKGSWVAGGSDLPSALTAAAAFFSARQQSTHIDTHWGVAVFADDNQLLAQIGPKGAYE